VDNNCCDSILSFCPALNNAGKKGDHSWTEEDDWAQLDEDLDD